MAPFFCGIALALVASDGMWRAGGMQQEFSVVGHDVYDISRLKGKEVCDPGGDADGPVAVK